LTKLAGPLTRLGILIAALALTADQLTKYWVLHILYLHERKPINVLPFLDFTFAWNKGVSYGLFPSDTQVPLLVLSLAITIFLVVWLARTVKPLEAAALGLLIGGAIGNMIDRALHGAVVDFVHLYWGTFSWYIFNIADVAIVAGVGLLVLDMFTGVKKSDV
jgi:signal peptidase II